MPPAASAGSDPATTGRSLLRTGLVLGLLSTLGPLAIDLYLPAFPEMARDLQGSPADIQRSLSIFFLAIAAAQLPWGSLGDRFGRKRPLYVGLVLFLVGTVGCALARDTGTLIAMRFLQGFGICAGTAVSRAIIRDLYTGAQAARLLALSYLVIGISPIFAPLIGSVVLAFAGWRALFWGLFGLGLAGLLLARLDLPESLPPERRRAIHPRALLATYASVLGNRRFMAAGAAAGCATTNGYATLTAAPFMFEGAYGLSPTAYSVLLGMAGVCSIGASQLSPNAMKRFGPERLLKATTAFGMAVAFLLAALALSDMLPLVLLQALLMLLFVTLGFTLTPGAVTALDSIEAAGAGAAMLGSLQLLISFAASSALTLFAARSAVPLAIVLAATWTLAFILARVAFLGSTRQPA